MHRERRSVTQSCMMLEADETPYIPQMIYAPQYAPQYIAFGL